MNRADRVRRTHPLKYLVVDPYLFIETQSGNGETETQSIKAMLTKFQTWGRVNHIWVVIVAHPRGLKTVNGRNELEAINMYTISGSANWANLADFILTVSRISEPDRLLYAHRHAEGTRPGALPHRNRVLHPPSLRTL